MVKVYLDREAEVEIQFGKSPSQNYEYVLQYCREFDSYTAIEIGKSIRHSITLPISRADDILFLWDMVEGWKSSRLLINGDAASRENLEHGPIPCFQNRRSSPNKAQYCFGDDYETSENINIWGCHRLGLSHEPCGGIFSVYSHLTKGNHFDDNGCFHIEKEILRKKLREKISENCLCPALYIERVFKTLSNLPETIDPRTDPCWNYKTDFAITDEDYISFEPEEQILIMTGIQAVNSEIVRYIDGIFKPKWHTIFDVDNQPKRDLVQGEYGLQESAPEPPEKKTKTSWF